MNPFLFAPTANLPKSPFLGREIVHDHPTIHHQTSLTETLRMVLSPLFNPQFRYTDPDRVKVHAPLQSRWITREGQTWKIVSSLPSLVQKKGPSMGSCRLSRLDGNDLNLPFTFPSGGFHVVLILKMSYAQLRKTIKIFIMCAPYTGCSKPAITLCVVGVRRSASLM